MGPIEKDAKSEANVKKPIILSFALLLVLVITVAAQPPQGVASTSSNDLSWAYGFAGPATARSPERRAAAEPAENRDIPMHLPDAMVSFTQKQIDDTFGPADWFPNDHPKMPTVVAHGDKPGVRACGFCHYPNGKGRPNNASVAGLPAFYIEEQLKDFRSGDRRSWDVRKTNTNQMIDIARSLTDDEMKEAADYFSSIKWTPWIKVIETESVPKTRFVGGGGGLRLPLEGAEAGTEPIGDRIVEVPENVEYTNLRDPRSGFIAYVPVGSIKRGEALVLRGGAGKTIGCTNCHGSDLSGGRFATPPLAGRSPSYLARQLNDIQKGTRTDYSRMMTRAVDGLSDDDIVDIVAYLASLPPSAQKEPANGSEASAIQVP